MLSSAQPKLASAFIAREGSDPVYGARPLKRFLRHELETRIGRALIAGDIPDGSKITVDLQNGALTVRHEQPAPQETVGTVDATE